MYTNKNTRSWTKVYRHNSLIVACDAANWDKDTYEYSSAKYVINFDLDSTDKTYCSKIVWQAYRYGPSENNTVGTITIGTRLPYDLYRTIKYIERVATKKQN